MSDPALRAAATGMRAQEVRSQVIANNLANVNTVAFKRSRPQFEDLLYQSVRGRAVAGGPEAQTIPEVQVGRGTRLSAVVRHHEQGALEQTGRPLDVAIEGAGYFQVQLPSGELAYTRAGNFGISDQGTLVTPGGYAVVPGIRIPGQSGAVSISKTGIVAVQGADGEMEEVGRIELARFTNEAGLEAMGENLYRGTPASGAAVSGYPQEDGFGALEQGSLEASNVEIVTEMTEMITTLRAYELSSKCITNSERMQEMATGMVR